MALCRIGENSDVYVIRNLDHHGGGYTCFHADDSFHADDQEQMIGHLIEHRKVGHMVPERAFDRLYSELRGVPYKTDVMRALEELELDQIGIEDPKILLDGPPETM